MEDRTYNGVKFRILNVIDEYTRECLAIKVARRLTSHNVVEVLTDLFLQRGVPVHIRSDNGPEFIAKRVREWLTRLQVRPLYIELGSPWENGYVELFNGKIRDELMNGEIFYSLKEAQGLIEMWRRHYNTVRPHSLLGHYPLYLRLTWFNLLNSNRLDYHRDWYNLWGQVRIIHEILQLLCSLISGININHSLK